MLVESAAATDHRSAHLGQGFPSGSWYGGIFTQGPGASAFEGFRWRSSDSLNLDWIWLQNYSPDKSLTLKFAHVVATKRHIGCLAP